MTFLEDFYNILGIVIIIIMIFLSYKFFQNYITTRQHYLIAGALMVHFFLIGLYFFTGIFIVQFFGNLLFPPFVEIFIPERIQLLINFAFVPILYLCWLYVFWKLLYPNSGRRAQIPFLIIVFLTLIYEIGLFLIFFGLIDFGLGDDFYVTYVTSSRLFAVFSIPTIVVFAWKSIKSGYADLRARGILMILAFTLFFTGLLIDTGIFYESIMIIVGRIIVIFSILIMYYGFFITKEKRLYKFFSSLFGKKQASKMPISNSTTDLKKIVIDCDCTYGKPLGITDDGLALLYLFGCSDFEIIGITTVFGNGTVKDVYKCTQSLINAIGRDNVPVFLGAKEKGDVNTPAAKFLAEVSNIYKNDLSIIALGTLTNLYGANQINPEFFNNLNSITLMGGSTTDWIKLGRINIRDANVRRDLTAAFEVLRNYFKISVISCQEGLQIEFDKSWVNKLKFFPKSFLEPFLDEIWVQKKVFHIDHIYIWDLITAIYFTNPELFKESEIQIELNSEQDLLNGVFKISKKSSGVSLKMPGEIISKPMFEQTLVDRLRTVHTEMIERNSYSGLKISALKKGLMKLLVSLFLPIIMKMSFKKIDGEYFRITEERI